MKKIAPKGSTEAFLKAHVDHAKSECLEWPYSKNGRGYGLAVIGGVQGIASRWMCILAHGESHPEMQAAHSCGNPGCVNPQHLRWATPQENTDDKKLHGTTIHGERNGRTQLTSADIKYIRAAPPVLKPLMEKFQMSKSGISKIRSGNRWGHVQ